MLAGESWRHEPRPEAELAKPSEAHVEVARRLLAHFSKDGVRPGEPAATARVHEALFASFAPIIGSAGFRALFARSVRLAKPVYPALEAVALTGGTANSGEDAALGQVLNILATLELAPAEDLAAGLYATFYALVSKFIGESLVQQIVEGAFPTVGEAGPEGR